MESNGNNSPLFLVFYLDREMMGSEMMQGFADHVDKVLVQKDANAMAFFVPTDGEERIECINPVQVEPADMEKINKMMEDIAKNFDIGQGADDGKNDPEAEVEVGGDE